MQKYSKELFVLPMIKTEQRGHAHLPFETGREKLVELLEKRVPSGVSLADVFEKDALDFLVEYSAGHVRNLMMFARETTLYVNGKLPIPLIAVQRAIAQTVSILVPSVLTIGNCWRNSNYRNCRIGTTTAWRNVVCWKIYA